MVTTHETDQSPALADAPTDAPAVPEFLVHETLNGRPLYYKGYRDVMAGILKPEDVMGSSDLQGIIVSLINTHVTVHMDRKRFITSTNESGLHVAKNDDLAADIAIFEKAGLGKLKGKYFDVPPKVVIEVDIKIDLKEIGSDVAYIAEKTSELFNFGVERVLWVLSKIRKVIVITPNQDWIVTDWSNDVPVIDDCVLNVKRLLDEEEIAY